MDKSTVTQDPDELEREWGDGDKIEHRTVAWRPWIRRAGWLMLGIGIGLITLWSIRLIFAGLSLRNHLAEAETIARNPMAADPVAACGTIQALRGDFVTLNEQAGALARLAPALGWLPGVGGDLRAAPHLLAVADSLSDMAYVACSELGFELAAIRSDAKTALPLSRVGRLLAEKQATFERAQQDVKRAQEAWARVDQESLSPRLARGAPLLDRGLPLLQAALAGAQAAPGLLGLDHPRTFLVLAMNEDELRPGGGFITGAGEIQIRDGRVVNMSFSDSYAVDDYNLPYPDPPEPLRRYMGLDLLVFRDSNWSPDFPTSAQQAIDLYRPGHPVFLDGVIALDQRAVQALIAALGSVTLDGASGPLTADTIVPYIRHAWEPEDGKLTREWWE